MSQKEAFKLNYPIEVDSIETDTLHLRRITVTDLEAQQVEKTELGKSILLVSRISGVSPAAIRTMDAADFNKLADKVVGFLE
ncbi:phage tail assembly protein [Candidatus Sororendozoicomonas aggregata]|uniref:phage tail assembly protein n=1 Tax=Candidatus Sororendozoicomonas aggregata TaxID=3073239 RepID=UPI002ED09780